MPDRRRPRPPAGPSKPAEIAVAVQPPPRDPDAFLKHVSSLTNHRAEIRALAATELARITTAEPSTAPTRVPRRRTRPDHLHPLRTWRSAALARWEDLRTGRTAPDGPAIPADRRREAAALTRRLVVGLSKNAARRSTLEGAQRRWHASAKAAREGIRIRRDLA